MRIIIAGCGDTAIHLARQLSHENQDVVLMGSDAAVLAEMDARYNILTHQGDATSPEALKGAGAAGCDLFIAVTPFENANIISAQLAKNMGAARTVARIDSREFLTPDTLGLFERLGVDKLVYPEYLAAGEIASSLSHAWLRSRYVLHDGGVVVGGVKIPAGAPVDGLPLRELAMQQRNFHVSAIRRGNDVIIPRGDDVVQAGDVAWFTLAGSDESRVIELCGKRNPKIRKVMVAGAGKMTRTICSLLEDRYEFTVVDPDRERCRRLARLCHRPTVVCADYRNLDALRDEKIADMDAFIALTDSAETNIVSCLVARGFGVQKTIAEIEDIQYFAEADSLDIDTVINKKLLTSSRIYQMLLDSFLPTPRCLVFDLAEVAEVVVADGAPITKAPVSRVKVPRGITIGAMVRDNDCSIVDGNTHIRGGDHLIVFCMAGSLPKLEKLLR